MNTDEKKALNEWDEYRKSLADSVVVNENETQAERLRKRGVLEGDVVTWCKFFFPKYAKAEFAPFHKKAIKRITQNPEWFEVLSWARELSKSTVVMFCILFLVLTGKKRNIILTSNSYDNAARLLEPYRANLDTNPRIRAYYGEQKMIGNWEIGEFTTTGGAVFRAIGAGQSPRGSRNEEIRPDTLLIDDFDTDEDCKNPDLINKKWDWWEKALYPTRSISEPLLVVFCGNIIAKDCCIVRAGAKADNWDVVNIRDEAGRSTWPAKNSEESIDRVLSKISEKAIQGEYYNNPVAEGEVFPEIRWDIVPPLAKLPFVVVYGDPATSNTKKKQTSTKGVFLVGTDGGKFYVYTGYLNRALNSEFVSWFYDLNDYVGGRTQVYNYIENNSLQNPFFEQVFKPLFAEIGSVRGFIGVIGDERRKPEKFARIEGNLQPLNKSGALILNIAEQNNPHMKRLESQFKLVSPGLPSPADGPDAVEGGVWILRQKITSTAVGSIRFGKRPKNKKRI